MHSWLKSRWWPFSQRSGRRAVGGWDEERAAFWCPAMAEREAPRTAAAAAIAEREAAEAFLKEWFKKVHLSLV